MAPMRNGSRPQPRQPGQRTLTKVTLLRATGALLAATLMAIGACRSSSPQNAATPADARPRSEEMAPSSDLLTGDQAAGMASEDAAALRLRPASRPARREPDVRKPRLNRPGPIGGG